MTVTRGLIIDSPWIDHILEGRKDWEMRSQSTSVRGWIGLIRKGSGQVVGVAQLVDCGDALNPTEMVAAFDHHRIPEQMIRSGAVEKWVVPWKLANIRPLVKPVRYDHKSGAVIWVTLSTDVSSQLADIVAETESGCTTLKTSPTRKLEDLAHLSNLSEHSTHIPSRPATKANINGIPDECRHVIGRTHLTEGNLNNNHFYLTSFLSAFPSDTIGGKNATEIAARALTIEWGGPTPEITDIDFSKKMFRKRGWVRKFFAISDAKVGDCVVVSAISPYQLHVQIERPGQMSFQNYNFQGG